MRKRLSPPPGAPDAATLRDAALAHLARYATTEAGLRRVLERRIDRWARAAEAAAAAGAADRGATDPSAADPDTIAAQAAAARATVGEVVARLAAAGALSDATFAETRARSLVRAGRSRLAVAAHLAAKGVPTELAREAVPQDADSELSAALTLARRRRLGPFRADQTDADPTDDARRRRELGVLARAGFPQAVAAQALDMDPVEAEERVLALRR